MADNNKKKYIKYEDTTYILEDSRIPDPSSADNGKVLGIVNGAYALKQEQGGGGEGTVKSVNNIEPDANGDVALGASDVHALPDNTVIPTVPQMATDPDMTDWESGKTVDAAVLAQDFSAALQMVNAKADASDIPTAVSQLTNDSGYQTAAQVQTAIAAIPAELPTVSASDNGKFLRVVSGAWAAQAVPAAESNSFGGGS